jgi:hypothetical protein|tara:strand:+ start:637 stop:1038 length:402 start_codon:yes stop_codon:yes gene_type:complete
VRNITIDWNGQVAKRADYALSGTSLQGSVYVSYKRLVAVFGKPNSTHDEYKIDAEWAINTPVGIASIYNYKDGKNYRGEKGMPVEQIVDWHIGGHNREVVEWVKKAVFNHKTSDECPECNLQANECECRLEVL